MSNLNNKNPVFSPCYFVLIIIFIFQLYPLYGQTTVSDSLLSEQITDIERLLNKDKISAQRWWYGWLIGYSAATVGQGIVYFSSDKKSTRQDMVLGAATTALGAIGQIITPIVPGKSSFKVPRNTNGTSNEKQAELVYYEELLKEIAAREKNGRSWKMHAITGAVNVSTGLITWLGFKRTVWDGVANFALNTAITELQIWTQPTRAIKDYKNYCIKYGSGSGLPALEPENEWIVLAYPGGIKIQLNF